LLRTPGGSDLGEWHYEVADTKLARTAKATALIQICSYVEQIERIQGVRPAKVYVVTGGPTIEVRPFRTAEMMAYYRHAKQRFEDAVDDAKSGYATYPIDRMTSYPDPVEHCAVCRWTFAECKRVWHEDDALPIVAGISRTQRNMLTNNSVMTVTDFSLLGPPIRFEGMKPSHSTSMWTMREQARLQVKSKQTGKIEYEFLDPEQDSAGEFVPNRGLSAVPPPSTQDLFFDIEGDPFAFWEGLEYLFGIWDGAEYTQRWAMNRAEEKSQFQALMDRFHEHWKLHPDMHIYHYGVYEPSRLKSLAGRHATHQDELDELLTANVFVDLYRVVRQGIRVGAERYSIKNLEPLYGFNRTIELRDANSSIVEFEKMLEIGDPSGELKELIAGYNRDDCVSTKLLRDWLEERRIEAAEQFGRELPRPRKEPEKEPKPPTDWEVRLAAVLPRLTAGLPTDEVEVEKDQVAKATWLLANLLDWNRRELKASWWRFFELLTLSDDELFAEQEPIAHLKYEGMVGETAKGKKIHRYTFPVQEHKVRSRSDLYDPRLPPFEEGDLGKGVIDKDKLELLLTRPPEWDPKSLTSVVPHDRIPIDGLQDAMADFAEWVADNGIGSESTEYQAVRDLLLGAPQQLDQVLQGAHPPGAEKSSLGHYLGGAETIPANRGLFLGETYRLHPSITAFTSEQFYEAKLGSVAGLDRQRVLGDADLAGSGVRWVPVFHDGNTNASEEEASVVADLWERLVGRAWVVADGTERQIHPDDVLIVSPFNAHRLLIQGKLPTGARVGTVDKFQGQEAPISIYTMATSRPEDAPRGVDFLYSLNRLNVATSRARALTIVVASPALLNVVPKTPEQLHMVNALCAFVDAAELA
ncbi:MAG: TM0106 family RecB-like putative nuclease, partial [Candidatus Limnocylindrales bacterium]